ncbi:unnamed protein product [Adineta steineri]|uniref:Uncharacterized protein n=1 Tax=Adineta steineri TaxID=433720 RepID=A0A814DIT2_9BILA|nr:unnamed protein product [Adineta steineri]
MTSNNGWMSGFRSRAQSAIGKAKTQIALATDTIDKKLKEAQEDLERQRRVAEAANAEPPQQDVWRKSEENPDGKILTVVKPPPINLPTIPIISETPTISTSPVEPPTVRHIKGKRRTSKKPSEGSEYTTHKDSYNDSSTKQRSNSIKQRDNHKDTILCLNTIITEIVNRENINECLNDIIDIISTVDELVENVVLIDTHQKENLISEQDSSSHFNDNIDINNEELISSDTESDEDSMSTDESTDQFNTKTSEIDTQSMQVSSLTNTADEPVEQIDTENLHTNVIDDATNISINAEVDEQPAFTDIDETEIEQYHSENVEINKMEEELSTSADITTTSFEVTASEDLQINTIDDESPSLIDELESPIEHSISNESNTITSENIITTSPNELEDSFDKLNTKDVPVHRPLEKPLKTSTSLAELRKLLSSMDDDSDSDEEPLTSKQDTNILNEFKTNQSQQSDTLSLVENILPSVSSLDITPEIITIDSSAEIDSFSDELSINDLDNKTSTILNETKLIERKRFSIVNYQSIPLGTKISHMICSSTYIYICTHDRKIFYAKLNNDNISLPLKWQQHSDFAERLMVSVSNRTVWRYLNKRLYSSNDPLKFPPIGSQWNEIKLGASLLSMSINDQCGWYIKENGTLWLLRTDNNINRLINVNCPFNLKRVFCFSEKVGVITSDEEILIRVGCTNDCPEGDGWIFVDYTLGPIDDFVLLTNNDVICIMDKKHRLWIHQWSNDKGYFEVLCNDDIQMSHQRYLISINSELLCLTDCEEQIQMFSDSLTGIKWTVIEENTRLQRLIGAFSNENYVWALTTDKMISSSNGQILEKPRQAQYITHATFVPNNSSHNTILWSLDESCNIYVRANVDTDTDTVWDQLDQSQFEWTRRLVHMVCNHAGVWAVDDQGSIHFRHGHISANQYVNVNELSFLLPAWITIPGEARRHRYFSQVFCGPADWMVYATDNKQNIYARLGVNKDNRVGTSWKPIEDCSALELAISEHTLWVLTSCGEIQCRENISIENPIGTRSTTLSGRFLSLTVSMDDSQVWALDSKRNLLKLDRLTVLFEK